MILEEITLSKDEYSKREAIQDNFGQQVILHDDHNGWCHGIILEERYDNEVYQMKLADAREKRQLHYYDLNQLLVISDNPEYKRPKID